MKPLVVTGTRSERKLSEAPVRTEVVNKKQIEQTESYTLADALEWITGVRVENDCQNCNFQQVRLLGLQGNFTQILNDGRPALSSLASVYGVEQIPSALVDRIEVVKGGGSALYGPGAIAGVVNIIPRDPRENSGYVDYGWSTYGGGPNHQAGFGIERVTQSGDLGVIAFGQWIDRSSYDHNNDGFSEVGYQEFWSGGIRSVWKPTDATRLVMDFNTIQEERRGGGSAGPTRHLGPGRGMDRQPDLSGRRPLGA